MMRDKEWVDRHPEIDKRLTAAETDVKASRVCGSFKAAHEEVAALRDVWFAAIDDVRKRNRRIAAKRMTDEITEAVQEVWRLKS
jgi:hypothetical protein